MTLTTGTRVYYGGDMENMEGFGTIVKEISSRWGEEVKVEMDDGREMTLHKTMFSEEYKGHGGTRFVTKEAYDRYRQQKIEEMRIRYAHMANK